MGHLQQGKRVPTAANNVAVIYCRVSTKGQQEDGTSLETQESYARTFCRDHGYRVLGVFQDTHTGAELYRPGLNAALAEVRAGCAAVLLAYAIDRLSRSQDHLVVIIHQVEQHGGRVEFVTEQLDNSPIGKFVRQGVALAAEIERLKIVERTTRGKRARAESGKILGTNRMPPYGFLWAGAERAALVVDPETAPVVQRIFRELGSGASLRTVALGLTADGIATPSQYYARLGLFPESRTPARYWSRSTVRNILRNPAYKGTYTAFRWVSTKHHRRDEVTGITRVVESFTERAVDDPSRVIIPCPAIVTPEQWQWANDQRAANWQEATRNNRHPEATLLRGGFIVCGYCGGNLVATYGRPAHAKRDYARYVCMRANNDYNLPPGEEPACHGGRFAISATKVDADVWARVSRILSDPEALESMNRAIIARLEKPDEHLKAQLDAYDATLATFRRRRTTLIRMQADAPDEETYQEIDAQVKELTRRIQGTQAERDEVAEQLQITDLSALSGMTREMFAGLAARFNQLTQDWPYETKRYYLRALGVRVVAYDKDHVDPGTGHRWAVLFKFSNIRFASSWDDGDLVRAGGKLTHTDEHIALQSQ